MSIESRDWWCVNRSHAEREALRRFMALAQQEPRLLALLTNIMREQPTTTAWYRLDGWKQRLLQLVGHSRKGGDSHDELHSSEAYDVVTAVLYSYVYDPPERDD